MATQPATIPPSHVLRARRIELVDEEGNIKMTLDGQTPAGVIRLWGKDGRLKASFGLLTTDQPGLLFLDGYLPRVDLRLEEDGQPSFGLAYDRILNACEIFIKSATRQSRAARRKAKKEHAPRTKK